MCVSRRPWIKDKARLFALLSGEEVETPTATATGSVKEEEKRGGTDGS